MNVSAELETAKAKSLILTQYFPEHSKSLGQALTYAESDPPSGLMKYRQILESVGRDIWKSHHQSPPPSKLVEIFRDPTIQQETPKRILNRVHGLRTMSNIGVHPEPEPHATVTKDDVLSGLNHLFAILDWYGTTYKELGEFPDAVQPPHSFLRYFGDSIHEKLFVLLVGFHVLIPALLFRFHWYLPDKLHRPFKYVYEGVFKWTPFSVVYSAALVVVTLILAWIIFKRFRRQDLESRLLSFELMYSAVFGFQFIFLLLFDYYVTIW